MFGMGMPEILLILAIALIVIGPKKLPDLARSLGRAVGEFKRATSDLKQSMEINTELGQVKEAFDEMNENIKEAVTAESAAPDSNEPETDSEPAPEARTEEGETSPSKGPSADA